MENDLLSVKKNERAVRFLLAAAALLLFAVFAVAAVSGLVMTCRISPVPEDYVNEKILYQLDLIPLNLVLVAALLGFSVFCSYKCPNALKRVNLKLLSALSLALVLVLGVVWVSVIKCVPEYDSHYITTAAADAARDDFVFLQDNYFIRFPFQLGYVFLLEGMQRLIGAENYVGLGIINVIALVLAYLALLKITFRLFSDCRVRFVTILTLPLFLQGPMFCTFIYGNVFGLACALWGVLLFLDWMLKKKPLPLVPAALLLGLAALAKPNYWIFIVACAIIALLALILKRRYAGLVMLLAAFLLARSSLSLITDRYERLADMEYGPGTPQTAWFATGMHGSYMAPGWYNGYTGTVYADNNFDVEATKAQIAADLKDNLAKMKNPLYCAAFFGRKFLSQYEETSFESIFVSKDAQNDRPVPDFVEWIYHDGEPVFLRYFDIVMQFVYVFAAWDFLLLFKTVRNKKSGPFAACPPNAETALCLMLLPVVLLGGFFYHMIFEGKSQYMLVYMPLLFPYAAHGLIAATDGVKQRLEKKKKAA